MNILQIGTTDARGGAARVSWQIKDALEKAGHSCSMFVADKHTDDKSVHTIPRRPIRRYLSFLLSIEDLYATDWILDTPEYQSADLVHCHNLHGRFFNLSTLQKMSQQKPLVWTLHDEWAITPHCAYTHETHDLKDGFYQCPNIAEPPRLLWNNEKYLAWRKKMIYQKSKLNIVTPSEWLKKRTENTVLQKQNIACIYNGVDTAIFHQYDKKDARAKLGLPPDKTILLFLADGGSSNPFKGWQYARYVMDHYQDDPNILLLSIGDTGQGKDIRDNIIYIDRTEDQSELAQYYSAADIFIHTSTADNFPLVILEAMACGLPIVAFNVGGVSEAVLDRETGYIATYRDPEDLIVGIDHIRALSADEYLTFSSRSVSRIKDSFQLAQMTDSYQKLYKELLTI